MTRKLDGFALIAAATGIAGVLGYLVTWYVYREVGAAAYSLFAVYWAALYLLVGGLSGIQQELSRATRVSVPGLDEPRGWGSARTFALVVAIVVLLLVVGSAPLWQAAVFPRDGWQLVAPLAVGAATYVVLAALIGSLYGVGAWRPLAVLIVIDGVLRLGALLVVTEFTDDVRVLAWVVSMPFALAVVLVWPYARRILVGHSYVDVGYRPLTWNVARTVLAAVSSAVLVSAFPLLVGVAGREDDPARVGEIIFAITLIRAPLIVTVMAFQSFFVVRFRDRPHEWGRTFAVLLAGIACAAAVLAVLGWWLGPAVLGWLTGVPSTLDGSFIGILVGSSALVAALGVTAPSLLALDDHLGYSGGWLAAAIATAVVIAVPLEFMLRVELAVVAGPVVGLCVHGIWLAVDRRRLSGSATS